MAMTAKVKDELSRLEVTKPCCRKAEVSATLRFAGGLHIVGGRIVVEAELDTAQAARRLRKEIFDVYGHSSDVVVMAAGGLRRGSRYVVRVVQDGEALARQFTHGKRYFLDRFGVETREVWLPDSFGYSAALPQIAAAAGRRWLLTQKISWNDTNRFPHHTFDWEGIDGTRILTHFPPVDTYNAELSGGELARAQRQFAEKGRANTSLVPFGWGDGGGNGQDGRGSSRRASFTGLYVLLAASTMVFAALTSALVVRVPAGAGAGAGWPGGPCSSWAASCRSASVSSAASMPRCCK